jgi:hypothetical protein
VLNGPLHRARERDECGQILSGRAEVWRASSDNLPGHLKNWLPTRHDYCPISRRGRGLPFFAGVAVARRVDLNHVRWRRVWRRVLLVSELACAGMGNTFLAPVIGNLQLNVARQLYMQSRHAEQRLERVPRGFGSLHTHAQHAPCTAVRVVHVT